MKPVLLRIGRSTLRAELPGHRWAAETTYRSPDDLSAAVAQLVEEIPGPRRRRALTLLVESPLAQLRHLGDLPAVSSRDLRAMIAMEAGRFFRKNGTPLVTDAAWISRRGTMRQAVAAAVEAPIVEVVLAAAREAGLDVIGIHPAGAGRIGALSLMPRDIRMARDRTAHAGLRRLGAVVLATWLLLGSLYPAMLRWERARVDRERLSFAGAVEALSGLRREVHTAERMLAAVGETERARGYLLDFAGRLSASLPDSAYLSSLSIRGDGSGLMSGRASRASAILASLAKADGVAVPRLEGPVLHEPFAGRQWEGFTIRFGAVSP